MEREFERDSRNAVAAVDDADIGTTLNSCRERYTVELLHEGSCRPPLVAVAVAPPAVAVPYTGYASIRTHASNDSEMDFPVTRWIKSTLYLYK